MQRHLRSIIYAAPGRPNLFELWFNGTGAPLLAPLATRDTSYQRLILSLIESYQKGVTLISVGAGIGRMEAFLIQSGLDVLATDSETEALRYCSALGVPALQFDLMNDELDQVFDIVYCDGVMGHLWTPRGRCVEAWGALARLGSADAIAVVSNDLADSDEAAQFAVRMDPDAEFYRPPAGEYALDAAATGKCEVLAEAVYEYEREGINRRREIVVCRLLVDDRIEAEDGTQV